MTTQDGQIMPPPPSRARTRRETHRGGSAVHSLKESEAVLALARLDEYVEATYVWDAQRFLQPVHKVLAPKNATKPFQCLACLTRFTYMSALERHQRQRRAECLKRQERLRVDQHPMEDDANTALTPADEEFILTLV